MNGRGLAILICAVLGLGAILRGEEASPARRVVVISPKANLEVDGKVVGTATECATFLVKDGPGGRLWVPSQQASLSPNDVIPFDEAVAHYTALIEREPAPGHFYCRAQVWRRKGDLDKALTDLNEAVDLDPEGAFWYLQRATVWLDKKEPGNAAADLASAIRLEPENGHTYANRGRVLTSVGHHEGAIADFTEALQLIAPEDKGTVSIDPIEGRFESTRDVIVRAAIHADRGAAWHALGNLDSAISDHDAAIRIDSQYAQAFSNRGQLFFEQRKFDKAISDCTEAIRLDPTDAKAFEIRGVAFARSKEYESSLEDLGAAIRLDPKSAMLHVKRSAVWRMKGDLDRAAAELEEALKLDPKSRDLYFLRADFRLRHRGDPEGALADYNEVIRLDPGHFIAYQGRSLALLLKRKGRDAIADCELVLDRQGWEGKLAPWMVVAGYLAAESVEDAPRAERFLEESRGKLADLWPEPIVRCFRGELTEERLLELATDLKMQTEARCYLGLHHLYRGRTDEARAHLDWVVAKGTPAILESALCRELQKSRSDPPAP